MKKSIVRFDFFDKLLVFWIGIFSFLIPLVFCFYTYDSAQVKITLFYICSCGAFFIWLSSLISKGESFFTKKNFYTFLPLLVYALYLFVSYIFKPYRLARLDSFIYEISCLFLFVMVTFSLKEEALKKILNYCFCASGFVFAYGFLQILKKTFPRQKIYF